MTDENIDEIMSRFQREPVPPVDGAFANRLEADLREQSLQGVQPLRQPAWWLRPGTVVAFGLLVVVVGFASGLIDSDPTTVEITSAQGSSISVPGSSDLVEGQPGMELVDGTRIEVEPGGSITVGGVVLEAGTTAIVEAGSVAIISGHPLRTTTTQATGASTSDATTLQPTPTTGTVVAPTTSPPTTNDSAPETDTTAPNSTTAPNTTAPPTTAPPTTAPPTTAPPKTAPPKTTVPPETRPTTSAPPTTTTVPARLAIGVEFVDVGDSAATLAWNIRETDTRILGWVVQVRRGDGVVATLATIRQPEARSLRIELAEQTRQYRVTARGEGGEILGESRWVSP